jgi:hypothetical protein
MAMLRTTAAAVICGILAAGCTNAVRLQLPPGDLTPAGAGLPAPEENASISLGSAMVVCLNQPGTATVVRVRGDDTTDNFTVQQYSVRPNPAMTGDLMLGDYRGPLAETGFKPGRRTVDAVCEPGTGSGYELGFQLARTGPGPASSSGFLVDWESATSSGTLRIPVAVVLCDGPTAFPARCDVGPHIG